MRKMESFVVSKVWKTSTVLSAFSRTAKGVFFLRVVLNKSKFIYHTSDERKCSQTTLRSVDAAKESLQSRFFLKLFQQDS